MSLPLLHAGRTNPGLSAALDLRFALDKSLTAYRGPTPSFSRASTGSYFDGSGVLRYATVNILTYSENFSDASWLKNSTTISSDSVIAPDGKTTADTLTSTSSTAIHYLEKTGYTVSTVQYTISIFAKYGTHRYLQISANNESSGVYANFDLFSGVVGSVGASATSQITNVGGGWYRCSMTYTATSTASRPLLVMVSSSTAPRVESITLTSGDYFYIWGCQQEASSTVGTYCPTTSSANSAPRFDHTYNGTSWVSRGLLVEDQRTNALPYSNSFSNWTAFSANITYNQGISPDGTNNATKIAANSSNAYHIIYRLTSFSSGQTYTYSVYAKAAGASWFAVNAWDNLDNRPTFFNLSNGTIGYNASGNTASIKDIGNGWYRCSVTRTLISTGSYFEFWTSNRDGVDLNAVVFSGDGSSGYLIYGAQVEAGAFPTSYIETGTSGSSATRSADVCQITGSDFSGFWNGTEGTVAVEFDRIYNQTSGEKNAVWFAQNSASPGSITMGQQLYNGSEYFLSQADVAFSATPPAAGITGKSATGYKVNDYAFSLNGASALTDTVCTVPTTVDRLVLGNQGGYSVYLNGHIARLRYYRKRLPNATLQLLSEPDPTLNLQFALNKSLTPVAGPAPSFSRASTGTYFNASGVLTSASINTPRFDHVYSGGQWVSRGLLVEEQRTNNCLQSNVNNTSPWSQYNETCTPNAAVAPDGTNTAALLVENTANNNHYHRQTSITLSAGTYTVSVYAKAKERYIVAFGGAATGTKYFNLQSGTVGATISGSPTATITNVGNGWYRLTVTGGSYAGGTGEQIQLFLTPNSETNLYTGDGTSGAYFWGAQIELGSFSTSLVPTTTSSVTRSADVCQITGTSFNWMWNQGEGSVAVEYDQWKPLNIGTLVNFNDGGTSNVLYDYVSEGTLGGIDYGPSFYIRSGGTWTVQFNNSPIVSGQQKYAVAFKTNDAAMSYIGGAVQTDATVTLPTVNQMGIGKPLFAQYPFSGHIAKLIYYPARLTNAKLQQLST